MQPTHHYIDLPDFKLSYYEWGNPENPTILFIHATGMHARVWDETIKFLIDQYHIIAIDQRGHGDSVSGKYLLDWSTMGQDAINFVDQMGFENIIGVGHSMGGHVMTQVALARPGLLQRMVLIDPVIFSVERYNLVTDFEKGDPKDNPIARRRNSFKNWQEMVEDFRNKPSYSNWLPETLQSYCEYGLKPADDGGYKLACAPDIEASVYMGHHSVNPLDELNSITCPVTILRARGRDPKAKHKIDFSASPTWDQLHTCFQNAKDVWMKDYSHFIPMETPELTAKYILADA